MKNSINLIWTTFILVVSCAKDQNANVTFNIFSSDVGVKNVSFNFSVSLEAGDVMTESGVLMSLEPNPVFLSYEDNNNGIYNDVIWATAEGGDNSKTVSFTELREYTKYYYKPFCVVKGKIQYGSEDSIITLVPPGITIGPAGGYVIYDDGAGGGIEMALEDIQIVNENGGVDNLFIWGCNGTNALGTSSSIGSGKVNTDTILYYCSEVQNAAYLCNQFVYNGFSDWYLPSQDELIQANVSIASLGYGNFNSSPAVNYWSSTQTDAYNAARVKMGDGSGAFYSDKYYSYKVRAFRSF